MMGAKAWHLFSRQIIRELPSRAPARLAASLEWQDLTREIAQLRRQLASPMANDRWSQLVYDGIFDLSRTILGIENRPRPC